MGGYSCVLLGCSVVAGVCIIRGTVGIGVAGILVGTSSLPGIDRIALRLKSVKLSVGVGKAKSARTHFFFYSFDSSLKCSSGSLDIKCRPCRLKRILSLPTCAKARGDTEYTVSGLIAHFRNCTNCFPTWGLFEPVIFHYRQQATF